MSQNDDFQPSPSESYDSQQDNIPLVQTDDFIPQENANPQQQDTSQYDPMPMGPQQTSPTNILTTDFFVNSQIQTHPKKFFYHPCDDFLHYHIECENIDNDLILRLLNHPFYITQLNEIENRYVFFYKQLYNNQFYQITCEIVPPSLINNCLNGHYYDIQIERSVRQEQLTFAPYQKENLRYHLELYLRNKILH
ncbi:uncharacterized protein OCT59_007672 [Rhizophagus irregularis]|uniref:Uncharacterized protein n=2 Tax=Rhizophagus irregularis TaxID=588596 RepID=U9UGH2_RHIID|nr:hypothetical protein GLOIN_2v1549630 [Rhizophagus irregularis DAOM 181602=DAOM 197198]EXX76817.1 hypothetical protein RirG_029540 [Rhizophagus irregularis DAOM 197198w]UZO16283.1 hypothetical protein OCT59_007672 [Rhizophagus irregularis]POG77138.1 hypothetical protein GLOIN_2v1549630 [Rhizophagus irregularis DAOM 181602=DAOM 197198]CAG8586238.1 22815_t:CDS:1 [Rhizophagus irregularis]GET62310.1 hypothetical protein GLOIN_2v1549630 [Rhizophagus irregularis DAOM 181602=DAOM 197198]|eukprot:XP_025184004.1 hypothetical protein GLOIN_2v1549630 [Rhizophagus irregularis DAOM 181602=DAOM 197198]